jgi:hypothetical protein
MEVKDLKVGDVVYSMIQPNIQKQPVCKGLKVSKITKTYIYSESTRPTTKIEIATMTSYSDYNYKSKFFLTKDEIESEIARWNLLEKTKSLMLANYMALNKYSNEQLEKIILILSQKNEKSN